MKLEPINLFLGEKTKLNMIIGMEDQLIMGWFPGRRMNVESLKVWMKSKFEPILGYNSYALLLVRGWMV